HTRSKRDWSSDVCSSDLLTAQLSAQFNSFGTHEFFELCRQLGCEAYVNGNLGSGTVQEMSEWVEYMTFDGVSPMADWRKENGSEIGRASCRERVEERVEG